MDAIKTLSDLKQLVDGLLEHCPMDAKINFNNRFEEFIISKDWNYAPIYNCINISCEKVGSVLEGHHRVLGGKE